MGTHSTSRRHAHSQSGTARSRIERTRPGQEKPSSADRSGLTPAQYTFCLAYIENGFNATRAYRAAHPESSYATARTEGARTLAEPNIRRYLHGALEAAWKPLHLGGDEALARIAFIVHETTDDRIKLAALKMILEQTGKLKPPSQGVDALAEALRATCEQNGYPEE